MSTESSGRAAAPRHLTLLCQGATRATRLAAFPAGDDPLENRGASMRQPRVALACGRTSAVYASPAASARETAAALSLDAIPAPELGECDFGRWRGLRLYEVNAKEPAALEAWFKDPSAAPHGGESLRSVADRANRWLESLPARSARVIVITNSIVIRQLILRVLEAPASSLWRIDVLPLSCVELVSNGTRWALRAT